jgi:hypothetical protein
VGMGFDGSRVFNTLNGTLVSFAPKPITSRFLTGHSFGFTVSEAGIQFRINTGPRYLFPLDVLLGAWGAVVHACGRVPIHCRRLHDVQCPSAHMFRGSDAHRGVWSLEEGLA